MSEPDAAFLKLKIERADLVAWLDARPASVNGWSDWREIGGDWNFHDATALRDIPEAELAETLAESDADLRRFATNRAALRDMIGNAEAPRLKRACYDASTREFIAGTLTFAENINPIIAFLALARSAADVLGPDGYGVVLVHNYMFAPPGEEDTLAAMRLGPGGASSFLDESERKSATGAFDAIVDVMTAEDAPMVDQLDELR